MVVVASTVTGDPPAAGRVSDRRSRVAASAIASWRRWAGDRSSGIPSSAGWGAGEGVQDRLPQRGDLGRPRPPGRTGAVGFLDQGEAAAPVGPVLDRFQAVGVEAGE